MPNRNSRPVLEELDFIINRLIENTRYPVEWYFAIKSGWDNTEFSTLYSDLVYSTQVILKPTDDATKIKGRPLEKIARYFLKEGGVVTDIREIRDPQRWQVDGAGPLKTESMHKCFNTFCDKFGVQLYMEAKNHKDPITNSDFSQHFRRMEEHDCYLGICISTSGYKMSKGKGIAQSIHRNYWRDRFHILLAFHSLYSVAVEEKAPLAILKAGLTFAINDQYSNDTEIQTRYSLTFNNSLAQKEYKRLFNKR
jgi:hypothetical protein